MKTIFVSYSYTGMSNTPAHHIHKGFENLFIEAFGPINMETLEELTIKIEKSCRKELGFINCRCIILNWKVLG